MTFGGVTAVLTTAAWVVADSYRGMPWLAVACSGQANDTDAVLTVDPD